jgi:HEAT repeat protein
MASNSFSYNEDGPPDPYNSPNDSSGKNKSDDLNHSFSSLQNFALSASHRLDAIVYLSKRVAQLKDDPRALSVINHSITHEPDPRVIQHAILIVAQLKSRSAVRALIALATNIHSEEIDMKVAVFEGPEAQLFKDTDAGVRLRVDAIRALGQIHDNRAINPLMGVLNDRDENYRVRLAAADVLGKLGCQQAVSPLLNIALDDQERSIYLKESAIQALGVLGDFRALAPLIDMLESKRGFRDKFQFLKEKVLEAIGRIGNSSNQATPKAVKSLLLALEDDAPSIRLAAVEALGWMGERVARDAIDPLTKRVFDTDDIVAEAAIEALHGVGGQAALSALLKLENLPRQLRELIFSLLVDNA